MREAAGILEVFGCVAAFVAADAAAKAANVRIESIDKNKPANADCVAGTAHHMPENQRQRMQTWKRPWRPERRQQKALTGVIHETYHSSTGRGHGKDADASVRSEKCPLYSRQDSSVN